MPGGCSSVKITSPLNPLESFSAEAKKMLGAPLDGLLNNITIEMDLPFLRFSGFSEVNQCIALVKPF